MRKLYLLLLVFCANPAVFAQVSTFTYTTGVVQTYTVPTGTYSVAVDIRGAAGGKVTSYSTGGPGGRVQCDLAVTAGEVLYVYMGSIGGTGASSSSAAAVAGGSNSGGGAAGGAGNKYEGGGGGGGSSDIRSIPYTAGTATASLNSRLVVAGGGGGAGLDCGSGDETGGGGGGLVGGDGIDCGSYSSGYCGTPPNQTTGGMAGYGGTNGAFGAGGACAYLDYGGGGGGGWYGAAGGYFGGACGGSGYTAPGITSNVTSTTGYSSATASGLLSITALCNAVGAITGNTAVCQGLSFTLSNATGLPEGTWSSSNTAVATINTTTGYVTGGLAGTATITYNVPNPCAAVATVVVTINPNPFAIGGTPVVCTGSLITLTESFTGGAWSSSNTAIAVVDGSGDVSGITLGNATITYTLPAGCYITQQATVNSSPAPLTGTASVCVSSTITLHETVAGGTWSSLAGSTARVDAFGDVSGLGAGTSNIVYTLPTGCTSSVQVTVNALPLQYLIYTGTSTYCAGASDTTSIRLSGSTSGVNYQLFSAGIPIGSPVAGTGSILNFGIPPSVGTYTITGTNTATGCVNGMLPVPAIVAQKPVPALFSVTHIGNSFCVGGAGVVIGLNGSATGVTYQLYNNGLPVAGASQLGTGLAISFGAQYTGGNYTVVATQNGTAPNCSVNMTGAVIVTVNLLPDINNITGGGEFCPGGTGVPIGLDYANSGVSYQLTLGGTPVGSPVLGTDGALTFGLETGIGTGYGVTATNTTTGCTSNMAGSASVSYAAPPTQYDVTGGGAYCAGGSDTVGLSWSDVAVNYQLYNGATPVGSPVAGVSGPIDFGMTYAAGTYKVVATDQTYYCISNMIDSAIVAIIPLPAVYSVTGGGSYCMGGSGLPAMLSGSQSGVTYTLFNGAAAVDSLVGTGGGLNFGTYATVGSYTVMAVNELTTCTSNMAGSAIVAINAVPIAFDVFGGGNYCAGGEGVDVGLDLSTVGVSYQLWNEGATMGAPVAGTGDSLDFGPQAAMGSYTVVGTDISAPCSANMSGSATVGINPLPANHAVSGGGSYCAGGLGMPVNISGSEAGISYQLYNVTAVIGAVVSGTGSTVSFGPQTGAGAYTVVATDTTTMCTAAMSGAATIAVNPAPAVFTMTGGGNICGATSGAPVGLGNSNAGINYALYNSTTGLVTTLTGSGAALAYGLKTTPGIYTVTGTNPLTGCSSNMDGAATIISNPLPSVYPVIGGGSYCAGSASIPSVGLANSSSGINYQLYEGGVPIGSAVSGSGTVLDFGPQSVSGSYMVTATDTTSGCTSNMSGSAVISSNPVPAAYTVTGGGSYCAGGAGYHIYLSISNPDIEYVLYLAGFPVDTVAGTGAGLDFGLQTSGGAYTILAMNPSSGCTGNMTGSANITINSLPVTHTVTVADGGNYCVTGTGVDVGLDGSNTGVTYQLYNGIATAGGIVSGTGSVIDFGTHASGDYTAIATNTATGCKNNMTGSAMVNAIPVPNVYATTGGGNYCTTGLGLHIGLSGSDAGTQYQLYHGSSPVGAPVTSAAAGAAVDFGLYAGAGSYTVVGTNGGATGCSNTMSGVAVITVYPVVLPIASIITAGGDTACFGNVTHFTASSVNGGTSPVYSWLVNGAPVATGSVYSYLPVDGDRVTLKLVSNAICAIPDTNTNTVMVSVSPMQAPSVNVAVSPGDIICEGAPVTFTGTSLFGGPHPVYTWIKNSTYVVGTGLTLSYTPANDDIIMLRMISDFPCRLEDTAFSNTNTLEVDPPVIPIVTISVNPGTQISGGQSVTFSTTVLHTGSAPTYQWLINGSAVSGATNATFTSNSIADNDSVSCVVLGGCDLQGFNSVLMHVSTEGVQQVTAAGNNITLVPNPNQGVFTIRGTLANTTDEEVSLEVVNMLGQVVYTNKVIAQNGNINQKIQLGSALPNGMYILNLHSGSQNNVFHFVIEQ